ncbi:response regulator [Pseudodesulfovibrio pelocollis]|uniref:response regulator n=1 Tax=Pseudodesulfovibrio pelocollis TaxID=3051432 RepID=UPI00255A806D|nr:response regulator [Pseudodesulfovibrio sp. SB368]
MSEKTTVLVVDDEERFASNMVTLLEGHDLIAKAVYSGEEALDLLQREDFDVILLDVKMPGLSGIGTLEKMNLMGVDSKVVVLTGHASVDDAVTLLDLGALDYLLKPSKTHRVLEMIRLAKEARDLQKQAGV